MIPEKESMKNTYFQKNGPQKDEFLPGTRIELVTQGFSILCSPTELPRLLKKADFFVYSISLRKFIQFKKKTSNFLELFKNFWIF